ncbi:hypothetical protein R84B8_02783 [Treponema sp. R8-4-B8]
MKSALKVKRIMKVFSFVMSCLVLFLVLGCKSAGETTSTVPVMYTVDQRTKFEILGEIIYESKDRIGYVSLLKAARNLYPDCDYVIDIMIDQRTTTKTETTSYGLLSFFYKDKQSVNTEVTYIMRGTAIKYIR